MRRAAMATVATVAGVAGLMSFHTKPATLSLGTLDGTTAASSTQTTTNKEPSTSADTGSTVTTAVTTTTSPPRTTTTAPTRTPTTTPRTTTPRTTTPNTTTTVPTAPTQIFTGTAVNYTYGILSVSVTGSGSHVTRVGIASISDGGNSRSESIDEYAIPLLESQALSAQSANVQGVSGASYTSAGFEQSLQAALTKMRRT